MSLTIALRLVERGGVAAPRQRDADLLHRRLEELPVLGLVDGVERGADQLHPVALEDALLGERLGQVERGLPAHGGQQRVRALALDDLLGGLDGDRLDVGPVGELRIGHHRGRVAVEEDDLHALLAERLDGLGAGVVELGGLADDDRPGSDDQDLVDIGSLGHRRRCLYHVRATDPSEPGIRGRRGDAWTARRRLSSGAAAKSRSRWSPFSRVAREAAKREPEVTRAPRTAHRALRRPAGPRGAARRRRGPSRALAPSSSSRSRRSRPGRHRRRPPAGRSARRGSGARPSNRRSRRWWNSFTIAWMGSCGPVSAASAARWVMLFTFEVAWSWTSCIPVMSAFGPAA